MGQTHGRLLELKTILCAMSLVPEVVSRTMETVRQAYAGSNPPTMFPSELLLSLYSIFGSLLSSSLDLVDRKAITLIRSEGTGRELVRVQGSRGLVYFLIRGQHYCPCPAYLFFCAWQGRTCLQTPVSFRISFG